MKILTKKKVDEILKRIVANEIMLIKHFRDVDSATKTIENNAEIVYLVGGFSGLVKVKNTVSNYFTGKEQP